MTRKRKEIRHRDCHLLWNGSLKLMTFLILHMHVWVMACHNYYLSDWTLDHWKRRFTLNSTHLRENPSDGNVDVKHQKRPDLFWNLIESFRRYSTACSCTPYCEVELLRPVAHIGPCKPSPKFRTWGVLNSHFYEPSSTYFIEVLIWDNQVLKRVSL